MKMRRNNMDCRRALYHKTNLEANFCWFFRSQKWQKNRFYGSHIAYLMQDLHPINYRPFLIRWKSPIFMMGIHSLSANFLQFVLWKAQNEQGSLPCSSILIATSTLEPFDSRLAENAVAVTISVINAKKWSQKPIFNLSFFNMSSIIAGMNGLNSWLLLSKLKKIFRKCALLAA